MSVLLRISGTVTQANLKRIFGRAGMPRDFKKSEKHLERRNFVIPSR